MTTKAKAIICFFILLGLYSCDWGFGSSEGWEWSVKELYVQKIEGSSQVLYKYDAWGGIDFHSSGFMLLDSSETFKIDTENTLPLYYLSNIPTYTKIQGVTHECYNSCGDSYSIARPLFVPMRTEKAEYQGFSIETFIYQYRGFSKKYNGLERYEFEKFVETNDSLFFYNLSDVESEIGIYLDMLKVRKGEVYILQNIDNTIKKIIVEQVIMEPITNALVDGRTYYLTPKHNIITNEFSERGIFREVRINK